MKAFLIIAAFALAAASSAEARLFRTQCFIQEGERSEKVLMQHDLARGHFNHNGSQFSVGISNWDADILVSITQNATGLRVNSFVAQKEPESLSFAQSFGSDYRKRDVIITCVKIQ